MESSVFRPTNEQLEVLGFFEGYGELWICPGTDGAQALVDMSEFGTEGFIVVNQTITHETEINNLSELAALVAAANAPF